MANESYSPPVQSLFELGWPAEDSEYDELGISEEHTAELIDVALLWADDEWLPDAESDAAYAPIHAWHALARLRAEEAVKPLMQILRLRENDEWVLENMPDVLGRIGPAAIPPLRQSLYDEGIDLWIRVAAGAGLGSVAMHHPQERERVVATLRDKLRGGEDEDPTLNASLIYQLVELQAVEALADIRAAFAADLVDPMYMGDLERVEIELGVRERDETPPEPDLGRLGVLAEALQEAEEERWRDVGRNDPCPCGSGKKYKHCCLRKRR